MPFRSTDAPSTFGGPADPFARFIELYEALDSGKSYFADWVPLRFAACTLITTPGDAKEIAERIEATDAALRARLSFFSSFHIGQSAHDEVSARAQVLAAVEDLAVLEEERVQHEPHHVVDRGA